jgi:hypothetical protein
MGAGVAINPATLPGWLEEVLREMNQVLVNPGRRATPDPKHADEDPAHAKDD